MTNSQAGAGTSGKRTDVGYKRPPIEHQFKKGQARPERKAKPKPAETSPTEVLWQILAEPRRITRKGRAAWVTNANLLVLMAFELAERGDSTMQRAVNALLFALEDGKNPLRRRVRLELDGKDAGDLPSYWDSGEDNADQGITPYKPKI
jgi:hypothetical protein